MPRSAADAIAKTVARYRSSRPKDRYYVRSKLHTDPLTPQLATLEFGLGDLVDVGCGRGQFGLLLFELGRVRSLFGYDWDAEKVATAAVAAAGDGKFQVADLREPPIASADTILLFDVLQYLSVSDQRRLLERLVTSLRPGGRILVRSADRSHGWQAHFSQGLERVARALKLNLSSTLVFRPATDLKSDLTQLGLVVTEAAGGASSLLDNRLLIGQRTF
ncbi:MAG: class I SAM-dependent methyltransferase [Myxococcales bacterium]